VVVTDTVDEEPRAADGRVPGRRGLATRQRLLDRTAAMLTTTSFRDLTVVDIAREAGTSPATFYQYFADVEAAILVLAEEMARAGSESLSEVVRTGSWSADEAYASALAVADAFIDFWEEHRALLRVVDLATDEGDRRFQNIRTRLLNAVTVALREAIEARRREEKRRDPVDPMATAGVLSAMLAHVSAHRYGFEFWGIRTRDLRESLARILYTTLTNQPPPTG
jgi:AcrR family transcriptional regulator